MTSPFRRLLVGIGLVVLAGAVALPPVAATPPAQAFPGSGVQTLSGSYETTNPIYPMLAARTGVVLYDLAGAVRADFDFQAPESSQVLGTLYGDITSGTYTLTLPQTPHGELLDFDGDPASPAGVQVFATTTYIDFRGDSYVNRGESPLNYSIVLEPMTFYVIGGSAIVWAARDGEMFPAGMGPDGAAFTADDPLMALSAGWSVVSLDTDPFSVQRESDVAVTIVESIGGLADYSSLSYLDAWNALYQRARDTYPFTDLKQLDWDALYNQITPAVKAASNDLEFHLAIASFGGLIPDTHVGYVSLQIVQQLLFGGVGARQLVVSDDGQVVIARVSPGLPLAQAGVQPGDILVEVDGVPALQALDETPLLLTSASTEQGRRFLQAATMLQGPIGTPVTLTWQTAAGETHTQTFTRVADITPILEAFGANMTGDVVTAQMLPSGVGYIRVRGFAEDVSAVDAIFSEDLEQLVAEGAQGIILDVRDNTGGLVQLAMSMAGHFFPDYERLFDFYYADGSGGFAYRGFIEILPSEPLYDGPVAVLVNEMTGSAGDLFAYAMTVNDRAQIVGYTPTGGFVGEVGDGQYRLPGGLEMQIPTGRPVDPVSGQTFVEGVGVPPDIRVPRTREAIVSPGDPVLKAAEDALLAQ
jgi:C-terminal processing protease CtpA/Prc